MSKIHNTPRWARLRKAILLRDLYTCQCCGVTLVDGRKDKRSAVVDHIEPVSMSPNRAYDEANLWAVCNGCHNGAMKALEARHASPADIRQAKASYRPVGLDGYPIGGVLKVQR